MRTDGGYDDGYRQCPCFWGIQPASMLLELSRLIGSFEGRAVLDVGCGEGKNAGFCASKGARVLALDMSSVAIGKAQRFWGASSIDWKIADVREIEFPSSGFDIVIAYGLFHCLSSDSDIRKVVQKLQLATKKGGYHVVCAMNDRSQDLEAHPGLDPCLLSHRRYMSLYQHWTVLVEVDTDLHEVHPHNCIPHRHSMTRLIARND